MTTEEARNILNHEKPTDDPRECGKTLCEAVDLAIEALDKQTPVRGITSSFGVVFCPNCERSVWQIEDESKYCFRCGQALKWEE